MQVHRLYDLCILWPGAKCNARVERCVKVRTKFAAETGGQGETSEVFVIFTGVLSRYVGDSLGAPWSVKWEKRPPQHQLNYFSCVQQMRPKERKNQEMKLTKV